jgi:hypothetical protein
MLCIHWKEIFLIQPASVAAAVVIHATNGMMVQDNTAFHVNGHAFYMEDGVEEDNWLEHNLAAFVHVIGTPSSGILQAGSLHIQARVLRSLAFI